MYKIHIVIFFKLVSHSDAADALISVALLYHTWTVFVCGRYNSDNVRWYIALEPIEIVLYSWL